MCLSRRCSACAMQCIVGRGNSECAVTFGIRFQVLSALLWMCCGSCSSEDGNSEMGAVAVFVAHANGVDPHGTCKNERKTSRGLWNCWETQMEEYFVVQQCASGVRRLVKLFVLVLLNAYMCRYFFQVASSLQGIGCAFEQHLIRSYQCTNWLKCGIYLLIMGLCLACMPCIKCSPSSDRRIPNYRLRRKGPACVNILGVSRLCAPVAGNSMKEPYLA